METQGLIAGTELNPIRPAMGTCAAEAPGIGAHGAFRTICSMATAQVAAPVTLHQLYSTWLVKGS